MFGVGPHTYLLLHWWHWLTYGNNATATAAVAAVITAGFAIKYTSDQVGIRSSQDEISRPVIEPVLVVVAQERTPYGQNFVVRNDGSGSALDIIF